MSTREDNRSKKDLADMLTTITGLVDLLKAMHQSRQGLVRAVSELEALRSLEHAQEIFGAKRLDGAEIRRSLAEALLRNGESTVETDIFGALERVLEEAYETTQQSQGPAAEDP